MITAADLDRARRNGALRVIVEAHARPGCAEQLWQQASQLVEPTRAEKGNLGYDVVRSLDNDGHFFFIEEWATQNPSTRTWPHNI